MSERSTVLKDNLPGGLVFVQIGFTGDGEKGIIISGMQINLIWSRYTSGK